MSGSSWRSCKAITDLLDSKYTFEVRLSNDPVTPPGQRYEKKQISDLCEIAAMSRIASADQRKASSGQGPTVSRAGHCCDKCSTTSRSKQGLWEHGKREHEGHQFKCPAQGRGKTLRSRSVISKHAKTHPGHGFWARIELDVSIRRDYFSALFPASTQALAVGVREVLA
jgi:hypothetical protein